MFEYGLRRNFAVVAQEASDEGGMRLQDFAKARESPDIPKDNRDGCLLDGQQRRLTLDGVEYSWIEVPPKESDAL